MMCAKKGGQGIWAQCWTINCVNPQIELGWTQAVHIIVKCEQQADGIHKKTVRNGGQSNMNLVENGARNWKNLGTFACFQIPLIVYFHFLAIHSHAIESNRNHFKRSNSSIKHASLTSSTWKYRRFLGEQLSHDVSAIGQTQDASAVM